MNFKILFIITTLVLYSYSEHFHSATSVDTFTFVLGIVHPISSLGVSSQGNFAS